MSYDALDVPRSNGAVAVTCLIAALSRPARFFDAIEALTSLPLAQVSGLGGDMGRNS
ncbi:hypothetical protein Q4555_04085 [Octadecabacter sp. 1_MG-2023]|uniref:hypothetical protein n=1 Tax=unclassified Octadecabacter TaxID=196158 RepID=UPI001C094270|nr:MULTISPECIES: hypothetical protein [unclassified Octadecabacter]MBU2992716.1 hypothetical protein [Octadecabacter sp. B2R22]MDO6733833.1 hypothetical protein [Octadecabacter sp. 1_MG-2023]